MKDLYSLLRINHWFKNLFLCLGVTLASLQHGIEFSPELFLKTIIAFLLASMVSSANYIINQITDKEFDAEHPDKKLRPLPSKRVSLKTANFLIIVLLAVSLPTAYFLFSEIFFISLLILFLAGIFYNIRPIRLKDIPYIDVLAESFNNPIRFILGWFVVISTVPSLFVLLFTWSLGAFFMTAKRYDEFSFYGKNLVLYRHTFKIYTLKKLEYLMYIYQLFTLIFLGVVLSARWQKFLPVLPVVTLFFFWVSKKVVSGEAKARSIESFVLSRNFLIRIFIMFTAGVILFLWH